MKIPKLKLTRDEKEMIHLVALVLSAPFIFTLLLVAAIIALTLTQ